jgi:hypothetical protein
VVQMCMLSDAVGFVLWPFVRKDQLFRGEKCSSLGLYLLFGYQVTVFKCLCDIQYIYVYVYVRL